MEEQEKKGLRPETSGAEGDGGAEPTPGDRIVAEIGRLAALRDAGALTEEALEAATREVEGTMAFASDGNGGFLLDFGMMPDPPRPGREAEREKRLQERLLRRQANQPLEDNGSEDKPNE